MGKAADYFIIELTFMKEGKELWVWHRLEKTVGIT